MTVDKAKDWAKECAESKGQMVILPTELNDEANEIEEMKKEVEKRAAAFNEVNLELENKAQNFWYKVRKTLKTNNVKGALEKSLGWNKEAQKDGIKVVNIISQPPQGMQM